MEIIALILFISVATACPTWALYMCFVRPRRLDLPSFVAFIAFRLLYTLYVALGAFFLGKAWQQVEGYASIFWRWAALCIVLDSLVVIQQSPMSELLETALGSMLRLQVEQRGLSVICLAVGTESLCIGLGFKFDRWPYVVVVAFHYIWTVTWCSYNSRRFRLGAATIGSASLIVCLVFQREDIFLTVFTSLAVTMVAFGEWDARESCEPRYASNELYGIPSTANDSAPPGTFLDTPPNTPPDTPPNTPVEITPVQYRFDKSVEDKPFFIRILIIGSEEIDKSDYIRKATGGQATEDGGNFHYPVQSEEKKYTMVLVDTGDCTKKSNLKKKIAGSHGYVLIYNVAKPDTFRDVTRCTTKDKVIPQFAPAVLLPRIDTGRRRVSEEEGISLARDNGWAYFEHQHKDPFLVLLQRIEDRNMAYC